MDTEERTRKKILIKASMVFVFALGLGFIIPGLLSMKTSLLLDKEGLIAFGKVNKVLELSNTEADWLTFEVDFTYAKHAYRINNRVMDLDRIYNKGDAVEVIFFAETPEDAIINSWKEKYSGNYVLILMGLLSCSISCYIFFFSKKAIAW